LLTVQVTRDLSAAVVEERNVTGKAVGVGRDLDAEGAR
jgi:hypothetical protein